MKPQQLPAYAIAYLRNVAFGDDIANDRHSGCFEACGLHFGGDVGQGADKGLLVAVRGPAHEGDGRFWFRAVLQKLLGDLVDALDFPLALGPDFGCRFLRDDAELGQGVDDSTLREPPKAEGKEGKAT